MYHELYIDVLFCVNFMMDYFLLLIGKRILKCSATQGNICIGSLAGSVLTCVTVVIWILPSWVKLIIFYAGIPALMLKIGLGIRGGREFLRGVIGIYIGGFLLGGVFTFLHQYVREGSFFFVVAVLSYHAVQGIWGFIVCMQRFLSYRCKVTLLLNGGECTVEAIIDTGNCLRDPKSNRPVCVLEEEKIHPYMTGEAIAKLRKIPFCSVGQKDGQLPILEIEEMRIYKEKEYRISHPVIGICGESISGSGEYSMILNPDIF